MISDEYREKDRPQSGKTLHIPFTYYCSPSSSWLVDVANISRWRRSSSSSGSELNRWIKSFGKCLIAYDDHALALCVYSCVASCSPHPTIIVH